MARIYAFQDSYVNHFNLFSGADWLLVSRLIRKLAKKLRSRSLRNRLLKTEEFRFSRLTQAAFNSLVGRPALCRFQRMSALTCVSCGRLRMRQVPRLRLG